MRKIFFDIIRFPPFTRVPRALRLATGQQNAGQPAGTERRRRQPRRGCFRQACRHCRRLKYASQNETPTLRAISRVRKIRMRLGAGFSFAEPSRKASANALAHLPAYASRRRRVRSPLIRDGRRGAWDRPGGLGAGPAHPTRGRPTGLRSNRTTERRRPVGLPSVRNTTPATHFHKSPRMSCRV